MSLIGIETQNRVKSFVEGTINKGLREIFGGEYSFEIVFEMSRNKPEAFLYLLKGNKYQYSFSNDELGGGMLDVVSFLMRLVIWGMNPDRSEPIFLLDEPFKFFKDKDGFEGISSLLAQLRDEMGMQFLIVSHDEEMIGLADKVWRCKLNNEGVSIVEEISCNDQLS